MMIGSDQLDEDGRRGSGQPADDAAARPPALWRRSARILALLPFLALWVSFGLAADTINVSQKDRQFTPDVLTIKIGTVVHIENDDNVTHHIYVDQPDMHFDSGEQPIGTTVNVPFNNAGSFDVQCAIHPTMHLLVKVVR